MENINEIMEHIEKEEEVNIKEIIFRLLQHWHWFLLFGFIGSCAAFIISRGTPSTYKMNASVIVNSESNSMSLDNLFEGFNLGNKTNVENHIFMLQSYTLNHQALQNLDLDVSWFAEGFLKDMGLYGNCPYQVILDKTAKNIHGIPISITPTSEKSYVVTAEGEFVENGIEMDIKFESEGIYDTPLKSDYFNFTISKNKNFIEEEEEEETSYYFIINNLNQLTKLYQSRLEISLANKKSEGILLTLEETIPARGVDYINELISAYLQYGLTEKNQTAENTVRFIDAQMEGIVDSLKVAGHLFTQFRSENGIVDLSSEAQLVIQKLKELETEKELAERRLEYIKNLQTYMGDAELMKNIASPSVLGIADAGLNSQVIKLGELYSKRSAMSFVVKDRNPAILMLNEEINNCLSSLGENIKNLVNNTSVELRNIKSQLSEIEMKLAGLPKTEQKLINIKRQFDLNNELYTFLLQKRAEAAITKASNIPDAHILDPARLETVQNTGPKTTLNVLIGLILGLAIPFITIMLADYLNDTIKSKEELEKQCKLPIVAEIARNKYPLEMPVIKHPRSGIAETFRGLRVNLQYISNAPSCKVVAIHSMIPGEGKTFCSLNLASIIALDNKKVLLIGCDLRKPRLHQIFNSDNKKGLSTYLIGQDNYTDIMNTTEQDNFFYINSGPIPPNPSELIGNGNFSTLINHAKKDFDYIVLDNAPVTLVVDGFLVGEHADINITVLRQGYSHLKQINFINQLKEKENFKNVSVILNDTLYKGYSNSYKYYNGYSKGYYDDSIEKKVFGKKLTKRPKVTEEV